MTNLVAMHFIVKCYVHDENAKELGEELAFFCKNRGLMVKMCWKLNLKIMILFIKENVVV